MKQKPLLVGNPLSLCSGNFFSLSFGLRHGVIGIIESFIKNRSEKNEPKASSLNVGFYLTQRAFSSLLYYFIILRNWLRGIGPIQRFLSLAPRIIARLQRNLALTSRTRIRTNFINKNFDLDSSIGSNSQKTVSFLSKKFIKKWGSTIFMHLTNMKF